MRLLDQSPMLEFWLEITPSFRLGRRLSSRFAPVTVGQNKIEKG
jgi:hypothetical protein